MPELPGGPEDEIAMVPRLAVDSLKEKYELHLQVVNKEKARLEEQMQELKTENTTLRTKNDELNQEIRDINRQLLEIMKQDRKPRK